MSRALEHIHPSGSFHTLSLSLRPLYIISSYTFSIHFISVNLSFLYTKLL